MSLEACDSGRRRLETYSSAKTVSAFGRLHSSLHLQHERPAPPDMQARSLRRAVIGQTTHALAGSHEVVLDMEHVSHPPSRPPSVPRSLPPLLVLGTNAPCLQISSHLRPWPGPSMAARPFWPPRLLRMQCIMIRLMNGGHLARQCVGI